MWWLLAIPVIGAGKLIYDVLTEESVVEPPRKKTVLQLNLERLRAQLHGHTERKVAILGQPGAGKSSLLKGMTNGKVKPMPVIGTETDATDWSKDSQCSLLSFYDDMVFVDVPGYDTTAHPTDFFKSYFPWDAFDVFILVVGGKIHLADESIYKCIVQQNKKTLVARSFSENLDASEKSLVQSDLKARFSDNDSANLIFFSNRNGEGITSLYRRVRL